MVKSKKKREIKGTSILTGFVLLAIAVVAIISVYLFPWVSGDALDIGFSTYYREASKESAIFLHGRLAVYSAVSLAAFGTVMVFSMFLKELEVIEHSFSKWINFISQIAIIVPGLLLIYTGVMYQGLFMAIIRVMLESDEAFFIWFPAPVILTALGGTSMVIGFRGSKKELKSIKYEEIVSNSKQKDRSEMVN